LDAKELDYRYFERPYFITPADKFAGEGYVVIREALQKTGKVGVAQVTIGGREWLVAIAPLQDGLVMELLRYAEELRDPADFFDDVPPEKPAKEMVDLAVQLITNKSSKFAPEKYEDHYQTALHELVQAKLKGRKIIAPPEETRPLGANVVDLMEALRKSLSQSPKSPPKPKSPKTKKQA
jgi:DNA end-binding protein Ku